MKPKHFVKRMGSGGSKGSGNSGNSREFKKSGMYDHCYNVGHTHASEGGNDPVGEGLDAAPCTLTKDGREGYAHGYCDGSKHCNRIQESVCVTGVSSGDVGSSSSTSRDVGNSQRSTNHTVVIKPSHVVNGNTVLIPSSQIDNFMKQNNIQ